MQVELGGGCDIMRDSNDGPVGAKVPHDGPMVAAFWRQGKFIRVRADEVHVNVGPQYAEIIVTDENQTDYMFVISNDPDIIADMAIGGGDTAAFEGFQLKSHDGQVLEQITIADSKAVN